MIKRLKRLSLFLALFYLFSISTGCTKTNTVSQASEDLASASDIQASSDETTSNSTQTAEVSATKVTSQSISEKNTNNNDLEQSEPDKNANNSSQAVAKSTVTADLDSWIGVYDFSEYAPPDQNVFYSISIYKEDNKYYADLSMDGFQTLMRLKAKLVGDKESVTLYLNNYLPENIGEPFKEGDCLLNLAKINSDVYTTWAKVQPLFEKNLTTGIYFKPSKN